MSEEIEIVQKGTEAFKKAKLQYLELFTKKYPKETIQPAGIGCKTTQTDLLAKIPRPFSCSDLELYIGDRSSIGFFCGRLGCLCSCCREDMEGEYPTYCPDPEEIFDVYEDEDLYDEEDYEDIMGF